MGIDGDAGSDPTSLSWFTRPKSAILGHVDQVGFQDRMQRIEDKLDIAKIEQILGYKFR
jgi:hypothetical protein